MSRRIRLRGVNGEIEGQVWESQTLLRIGRSETLEIALDDTSVSRKHAEIRASDKGWLLRDLDSTNGTFVNGTRVPEGECRLQARDIIQFGARATFLVEQLEDSKRPAPQVQDEIRVEAVISRPWEQSISRTGLPR